MISWFQTVDESETVPVVLDWLVRGERGLLHDQHLLVHCGSFVEFASRNSSPR